MAEKCIVSIPTLQHIELPVHPIKGKKWFSPKCIEYITWLAKTLGGKKLIDYLFVFWSVCILAQAGQYGANKLVSFAFKQ